MSSNPILKIVRLDGIHFSPPTFTIPHTYTEYANTPRDDDSTIASRVGDADVVITTTIPISRATLEKCPGLRFVAVMAVGTDLVDLKACGEMGVRVANVPAANHESVADHAIAFYFALRRNLLGMHAKMSDGKEEYKSKGSLISYWGGLPRTSREETLCILGGGPLGNRIANLAKTIGMQVHIADRKGTPLSAIRPGRVEFTTALKTSTVIVLTVPLTPSTINLISTPELALMRPEALLINVSRGGTVHEAALVKALREQKIAGAASDVYVKEPAGRDNPLVQAAEEWRDDGDMAGRLILSPHVAWFAVSSSDKVRRVVTANVEAWSRGEELNVVA